MLILTDKNPASMWIRLQLVTRALGWRSSDHSALRPEWNSRRMNAACSRMTPMRAGDGDTRLSIEFAMIPMNSAMVGTRSAVNASWILATFGRAPNHTRVVTVNACSRQLIKSLRF